MSHVLLSTEAEPCLRRGALIAAVTVALIGAVTVGQLWSRRVHVAPQTADRVTVGSGETDDWASFPPDAPSETAELVQRTGASLRGGLTPSVRAFADSLYIGIAVWEVEPGQQMDQWKIVFVNTAASPMLGKDMTACVGSTIFDCFPELDNDAGHRYGDLVRLSLATGRTVHVGATRFAQTDGALRVYYNAIAAVDSSHVAVLYHVLNDGPAVKRGRFALGLDLPEEQAVDVQLRVLSDVAAALDHKLAPAGSSNVGI